MDREASEEYALPTVGPLCLTPKEGFNHEHPCLNDPHKKFVPKGIRRMKTTTPASIMICTCLTLHAIAATIPMGTAHSYAVLGSTTVTNTGLTQLDGDLGVYSGTAISGFFGTIENEGPGTFTGLSHQGDAVAQQAQADALTAFNQLSNLEFTQNLTGQDLGGLELAPGVYRFDTTAQLTGTLTLDGGGLYVFQIGSTLTTAANASITFLNGANPFTDIFWKIGSSSTFGADTLFGGTVIADQSQTLGNGTQVDGRILALNGAVTLDNNIITVPEISSLWMMSLAGIGALLTLSAKRSARQGLA